MPEQSERPESARDSSARQRMQLAEQLAEQLSKPALPSRPSTPSSERPSPAPIAQAPAMARPPAVSATPKPPARRPMPFSPPLIVDADGLLLQEFTDSGSNYHPLSIADLLDVAFRLYRRRLGVLSGIAAIVFLPMVPLLLLAQQQVEGAAATAQLFHNALLGPIVSGALIYCIARLAPSTNHVIGAAYRAGIRRYWSLIGAIVLLGLVIGIPAGLIGGYLFAAFLGIGPNPTPANIAVMVAVVALVALVVLPILTRFALINQIIMLEEAGAVQSLRRSWQLTNGRFWRTFGVSTCSGILSYLISALPAILINFIISLAGAAEAIALAPTITVVGSQIGTIVAMPLQLVVTTLLYYDLRIRSEGYDLEVLAQRGLDGERVSG